MEIKKKYRRGWFNVFDREITYGKKGGYAIENPFNDLPNKIFLSKEEKELLAILENKNRFSSSEMMAKSILRSKSVIDIEDFQIIQRCLRKLLRDCKKKNIQLPKSFLKFFQTHDYLTRFRTGDLGFITFEGLNTFPNNENYYITPFFGDSQGFCWWYLLLNRDSEYCILYNTYHWNEIGKEAEPDELIPEYIICSDSFEEFIVRLAKDIKDYEGENIEQRYREEFSQFYDISFKQLLEKFPEERIQLIKNEENLIGIAEIVDNGEIKNLEEYLSIFDWLLKFDRVEECQTNIEKIEQILKIRKLNLSFKPLFVIPNNIDRLHNLKELALEYCRITELPKSIGNLNKLQILNLASNRLEKIPLEIGQLSKLKDLALTNTYLKEFPYTIVSLANLEELCICSNELETLPSEIGNLQNLKYLNIWANKLKHLPDSIKKMHNLVELNLSENRLSILPENLKQLKNLTTLKIQKNAFARFPIEITKLKSLQHLEIDKNLVSGLELDHLKGKLREGILYFYDD